MNIKIFYIPAFILVLTFASLFAQQHDWKHKQGIRINEESAHGIYIPYETIDQALADYASESPFCQCLKGIWKFNCVKSQDLRPIDICISAYDNFYKTI